MKSEYLGGWKEVAVNKPRKKVENKTEKKEAAKEARANGFSKIHRGEYENPLWNQPAEDAAVPQTDESSDDGTDGITQSKSLWTEFASVEEKKRLRQEQRLGVNEDDIAEGNGVVPSKKAEKPKVKKPKIKKKTVAQVAAEMDIAHLQAFLIEVDGKYPDAEYALLRVADYLEKAFKESTLKWDKVLEAKAFAQRIDVPVSELRPEAEELLAKWVKPKPKASVEKCIERLITEMFNPIIDPPKQTANAAPPAPGAGVGVKMLVQVITRLHPATLIHHVPKLLERCTKKGRLLQATLPSIIWLLAQTSITSPGVSLGLWGDYLLPLLEDPSCPGPVRDAVLDYISYIAQKENLSHVKSDLRTINTESPLTPVALDRFLKMTVSTSPTFAPLPAVRERLEGLYSALKEIVFFPHANFSPRLYFPYLLRLIVSEDPDLSAEALSIASLYVIRNKKTLPLLSEHFIANFEAITRLFTHLASSQDFVSRLSSNPQFMERLKALIGIIHEIQAGKYKPKKGKDLVAKLAPADVEAAEAAAKTLEKKIRRGGSSSSSGWNPILLIILLLVPVLIAAYVVDPSLFDALKPYLDSLSSTLSPKSE